MAVLLNKVVIEYVPRYGQRLADEVRNWGAWIKEQAEKELAEFYPKDQDGATSIAYLWARTITCEGPGCGCEIPLLRSFWLAKKGDKSVAVHLIPTPEDKRIEFEIVTNAQGNEFQGGTVRSGAAICPCCGFTTATSRVKAQLIDQRGGANYARLFAVYVDKNGSRYFRSPNPSDLIAFEASRTMVDEIQRRDADAFPTEIINPVRPYKNTRGLSAVTRIGCTTFKDLYNCRQLLSLMHFYRGVKRINADSTQNTPDFALALKTLLTLAVSRGVYQNSSVSRWDSSRTTIKGAFSKQALAVVWDFAEANPFSGASADWDGALEWIIKFVEENLKNENIGQVVQASATQAILPIDSVSVLFTDPPYFAAIPYGDLSDFFYVWLSRSLDDAYPEFFKENLVDKTDELIVTDGQKARDGKSKDEVFFRGGMTVALSNSRDIVVSDGIGVVVYAEATTAGWEAILAALIDAGWVVTASWPIDTEMENRTRAQTSASLQSSIHIVCRPREGNHGILADDVGDWRDVLGELPHRIREWLPRLEQEGIVGADAIFACIGPAMEIYSRYSYVEKASGDRVPLREYLEQVWAVVSREALNLIFEGADTSDFEEDARLTVIWFWSLKTDANGNGNGQKQSDDAEDDDVEDEEKPATKKSMSGYSMEYDTARKIAQGLGADLRILSRPGGIVTVKGNLATLNNVAAREDYLIGIQLSLFGDEVASPSMPKAKRQQNVSVRMRDVSARQHTFFDTPQEPSHNPREPQLPGFKQHFEDQRTVVQRLLDSGMTILDRLHQAMLIHGRGQTALLGTFLNESGMGADARFWRLADVLLRLYPKNTEEYRWLDGVLARKKTLGF